MYRTLLPQNHFRIEEACRHCCGGCVIKKKVRAGLRWNAIEKIVTFWSLSTFTDAYVDAVIHRATGSGDKVIGGLARAYPKSATT